MTMAHQASLSITNFLELAPTHVHQVSNAIQPSHSLSSSFLMPSVFPSIRVFSNESAVHNRWLKYWSFSLSISRSNECSGLISFKDWLLWSLLSKENFLLTAAAPKSLQLCLTLQTHRWQPTRLLHLWDSPGKNTGVGCHALLHLAYYLYPNAQPFI